MRNVTLDYLSYEPRLSHEIPTRDGATDRRRKDWEASLPLDGANKENKAKFEAKSAQSVFELRRSRLLIECCPRLDLLLMDDNNECGTLS